MQAEFFVFQSTLDRLWQYILKHQDPKTPVTLAENPEELRSQVDLSLHDRGLSLEELLPYIDAYLDHSTATVNPRFLNLLFGGVSLPGLLGEWVTSVTNTTLHTYDVAPLATLMELELIHTLNQWVGFPQGDGVMVTGGSNANLVALLCARHRRCPEAKMQGIGGQTLVAYVSDQAHYSYDRAVNTLGLGLKNLVKIPSTSLGQMDPHALEAAIEGSLAAGHLPFFIGATGGTTVRGAFDPLPPLADIAQTYHLWLHVDAAWGCPVLLHDRYRDLLQGCDRADSFTWDAHKLMGVPLIASALLVKQRGLLESLFAGGGEDYLFHSPEYSPDHTAEHPADFPSTPSPSDDLGKRSLQCGRRVDAFKFWLSWKYYGHQGYRDRLDHLFMLRDYAVNWIQHCDRLELLEQPPFLNICFRYRPPQWSGSTVELNTLNWQMRDRLVKTGSVLVNYALFHQTQPQPESPPQGIIRLVLANPDTQPADLDRLFQDFLDQA